ncbi:MAG TPA: hypothetical protein VFW11_13240 [Cyclobacteriaceae bacterium]|nr:hypothetical protein [Cyclobacteriaceae bacterium]
MKRVLFLLFITFSCSFAIHAQKSAEALEKDGKTLQERYRIMKEKSETFTDYKVIRMYVLDGMWKITMDSLGAQKKSLADAHSTITKLENDLKSINDTLKKKDNDMAEMEHSSTHISVLGIDVLKTAFLSMVGIITLGLLVLLGLLLARVKWVQSSMREKIERAESLSHEFEEYKRHALDKQMKLSRELQDERNKMHGLRST